MRNLKLLLSYDGTDFHGWQTQPEFRTVQETLEKAITAVTGEKVFANASGRTDTGVHALGQVVNFKTHSSLSANTLLRAINANLPPDVIIREAADAVESFDANRDAERKLYRYVIHAARVADVFLRRYAWHVPYRIDLEAMKAAAEPLVGRHDFRSFETEWPNRKSSVRTVTRLSLERTGEVITIDVEADGFLYNMVRSITGTLVNVGRGYWSASIVQEILKAEDRRQAGPTAPAHGLFLVHVTYPPAAGELSEPPWAYAPGSPVSDFLGKIPPSPTFPITEPGM